MACLNGNNADTYSKFDIENDGTGRAAPAVPPSKTSSSRRCSLPLILSALTILLSVVALALAIDASVKWRRVYNGPEGVLLTSNPRSIPSGYKAVNMFEGTGYFARLQPMTYPRSDHKVSFCTQCCTHATQPLYRLVEHPAAKQHCWAALLHGHRNHLNVELTYCWHHAMQSSNKVISFCAFQVCYPCRAVCMC